MEELKQHGRLAHYPMRREKRRDRRHAAALSGDGSGRGRRVGVKWFQVGLDRAKLYLLGVCALLSYWPCAA